MGESSSNVDKLCLWQKEVHYMYVHYHDAITLLPLISKKYADNTADWRAVCIALKNCGVPYELFENWSLTSRYQDKFQIRMAWQNLRGNYSIGTLCHYVKAEYGYLPTLSSKVDKVFVPHCETRQVAGFDFAFYINYMIFKLRTFNRQVSWTSFQEQFAVLTLNSVCIALLNLVLCSI